MKFIQLFMVATLLSFCIAGSSFAATVDLTPVIDYGVQVLTGALMGVGTGVLVYIGRRFKILADIEAERDASEKLERAIQTGFQYARQKIDGDILNVEVKSQIVAMAVNYILPKIGKALKTLTIDQEGVKQRVEGRIVEMLGVRDQ